MIPPVKSVLTEKDWELYVSDGKLLIKFKASNQVYEFRRHLGLKFLEELEQLLRPIVFSTKGEEEELDLSSFLDQMDSDQSNIPIITER